MAKGLRYDDALKLLGAGQSKILNAIDAILDGALLGTAAATGSLGVVGLFDAKSQLVKHGHALVAKLGQRARGVRGQSRMDLLTAAHTVIVLTAYFESLPEMANPDAALDEQLRQAGVMVWAHRRSSLADALLHAEVPVPLPHLTQDANRGAIERYYAELSMQIRTSFVFPAVPDGSAEGRSLRLRIDGACKPEVVDAALRRYDELFLALCRDCLEFALWTMLREHSAGRAELASALRRHVGDLSGQLDTALDGLRQTLDALVSTQARPDWSDRLSRHYQPLLAAPIAEVGPEDSLAGLTMPALGEAYVNPGCRVATVESAASVATDSWWAERRRVDDVQVYLTAYLTSPVATDAPLVLLGQPGSGKSVLTRILVAELPAGDFLPVRVELRQVPADDSVQDHIEHAVRDATGSTAEWPEVVDAAGGALPVVILDGFDELLQSTRVTQSNYLEQLQRFQRREAGQGRPVAVIVTSRTVVADRVRYPEGMVAVRLEPFSRPQIRRWLEIWNRANGARLAERGLERLTLADVERHGDLASQPLLLLMLALYDADGNRLPREGGPLNEVELYERLLDRFVRREVGKDRELDERAVEQEVARELHRLSIVAFGMFNRGRVHVHDDEVDADLRALAGPSRHAPQQGRLGRAYSEGQLMVGRFFFVHESRATHGPDDRAATYEFLHATFGEYLVARLTARIVKDLARRAATVGDDLYPAAPDDARLHAMLSWTPLTGRMQVVVLLRHLLADLGRGGRELLLRLFRDPKGGPRPADLADYRPFARAADSRLAIYQANLLLLLLCVGEVRGSELFPTADDPVPAWQSRAHLWRAHCAWTEWSDLIHEVGVLHERPGAGRDVLVWFRAFYGFGFHSYDAHWWSAGEGPDPSGTAIGPHQEFLCQAGDDLLVHAWVGMNPTYMSSEVSRYGRTIARLLVELRMDGALGDERVGCYREAADRVDWMNDWPISNQVSPLRLLLQELRRDVRRDPSRFAPLLGEFLESSASNMDATLALAILIVEEAAQLSDAALSLTWLRRSVTGLLPASYRGSAWYPEYLRLWVGHLEAGIEPVELNADWASAEALAQANLGTIAKTHPALLVRIVRAVARTGDQGGTLASRIASALPRLPAGALNQLTESEVTTVGAHADETRAARALRAWKAARQRVRDAVAATGD